MKKYLLFFLCVSLISLAQPRISAHRGNTGRAPENTLATYKNALKLRVNFIEIDVRTSADGKLIILHDGTLNRTTTGEGPVKNQAFSELKKLSAGKGHAGFEKEKIPSLKEVCELISRWNIWHSKKTFIYVDCKEVAPKPLVEILQKYGLANESCFYGNDPFFLSLTSEMVEEIHAADVRVFTDLLGPLDIETNYKKAAELGVDLIQTDKPALVFKTLNR